VADIIRTWPANCDAHTVAETFSASNTWARFYFTLGRGKPKQTLERLWWTYQGRIIGSFKIDEIIQNDGSLPRLHRIDGDESSEWQCRRDSWIAVCTDFEKLKDRVFMSGFRGFRYFNLAEYKTSSESLVRL
jgi:hypothetical protein